MTCMIYTTLWGGLAPALAQYWIGRVRCRIDSVVVNPILNREFWVGCEIRHIVGDQCGPQ